MGSYGDRILNCVLCGLRGKCVPDEFLNGAEPLTDCDFAGGALCAACLKAGVLDLDDADPSAAIASSSATPLSASQPVPEVRCGRPEGNSRTCRRPGAQYDHDVRDKTLRLHEQAQRAQQASAAHAGQREEHALHAPWRQSAPTPKRGPRSNPYGPAPQRSDCDIRVQQSPHGSYAIDPNGEPISDLCTQCGRRTINNCVGCGANFTAHLPLVICLECSVNCPLCARAALYRHRCVAWRPKEGTVQCCDCGSYYHTADAWKFHTETTTHTQCRDVKEKVQFFTKDADFSESPAVTAEVDDPSVLEAVKEQEADMPPLEGSPDGKKTSRAECEGTNAWFMEARRRSHRDGGPDRGDDKTKADVDNQKKAAAVNEKKAEAYNQQTAEADTQKTASDADIHQKSDADSPLTTACEKRKVVLPAALGPKESISKPGKEKRRRVQESDCIT